MMVRDVAVGDAELLAVAGAELLAVAGAELPALADIPLDAAAVVALADEPQAATNTMAATTTVAPAALRRTEWATLTTTSKRWLHA